LNNSTTPSKKTRALIIFSGGLDSLLAAQLLGGQGLEVTGLTFESHFFNAQQARVSAQLIKLPLLVQDFSPDHLEIVKNPRHGRGKTHNPCIDCHKLMLLEAWKIKQSQGFDILASGEVLGQRPLSQTKKSLDLIDRQLKKVSAEIEVLRPLSAQLLAETHYEKMGLVDRTKLSSIQGRNRKQQLALAQELGISDFPTPSGGCLLTVPEFSRKLQLLFQSDPDPRPSDFELLKIGRHFWLSRESDPQDLPALLEPINPNKIEAHLTLGRNKEENQQIWKLKQPGDILIEREDLLGPTALLRFCHSNQAQEIDLTPFLTKTRELIFRFSKSSLVDWRDLPCKITKV